MHKLIIEKIPKKDNAIIYFIMAIPICFLIFCFSRSAIFGPSTVELIQQDNLMEHFHGKIDSLYFDRENHNVKYAESKNKDKYPIFRNWEAYIQLGDSLSKNKNSFKLEIFKRNGSKIVFDYRDNYKKVQ